MVDFTSYLRCAKYGVSKDKYPVKFLSRAIFRRYSANFFIKIEVNGEILTLFSLEAGEHRPLKRTLKVLVIYEIPVRRVGDLQKIYFIKTIFFQRW